MPSKKTKTSQPETKKPRPEIEANGFLGDTLNTLFNPKPEDDVDPESYDFGEHDRTAARGTHTTPSASFDHWNSDTSRVHYGDAVLPRKALKYAEEDFEEKFRGKKVSRAELGYAQDLSEEGEDEAMLDGDAEAYDADFEEDEPVGSAGDVEVDERERRVGAQSELIEELRRLKREESEQIQLLSSRSQDDVERGRQVRRQLTLWEQVLNVRVELQPLLNFANRLPAPAKLAVLSEDAAVAVQQQKLTLSLQHLLSNLIDANRALLTSDKVVKEPVKRKSLEADKGSKFLRTSSSDLALIDKSFGPFWRDTLDKWHQKLMLSSELSSRQKLKIINQDIWQQVDNLMRDRDRLVARTNVVRSSTTCPIAHDEPATPSGAVTSEAVFDDTDFYQQLFREWVESRQNTQRAGSSSSVLVVRSIKHDKNKVERRASKGRKLRFDVHPKLVNYMVPSTRAPEWSEEKTDELYKSLLGATAH